MAVDDVVYDRLNAAQTAAQLDALVDVYAEVFAEEPYCEGPEDVARFRRWLRDELKKPGFTLVRAVAEEQLIGYAYGYTMPPGEWWRHPTVDPPAEIRDVEKFAVMEWAVRSSWRGHGIGRRLLDQLLAGRPEPYATLTVNPAATARRIYQRWGWRQYGAIRPKRMPPMDVLAIPLDRRPRQD